MQRQQGEQSTNRSGDFLSTLEAGHRRPIQAEIIGHVLLAPAAPPAEIPDVEFACHSVCVHFAHSFVKSKRTPTRVHNARMDRDILPPEALRLIKAREKRGFETAKAAADYFGWNYTSYSQHERGQRGLKKVAASYAKAFQVTEAWLLTGEGGELSRVVPIMGYVGAGAEILPEFEQTPPEGLSDIELPFSVPDDLIGLEIRGDSMLPRYDDGDIILVHREQINPTDAFVGEEAAVRTADGRRYLKRLMRGFEAGTYNLESWNARLIEGVHIDWVGEIYLTVRSGQLRRIERNQRTNQSRSRKRSSAAAPVRDVNTHFDD
jgi:phage repressor protein C with HTH and peptisase S24 domain